jgi:3-carboxy-cis,cis-muconate cycloisomerase/3-oxoadipate enol-lactonase
MRPSSSPSEPAASPARPATPADPFAGVLAAGPVADAVAGPAWVRAMLAVEAALATVQGRLGLVPADAVEAIVAACEAGVDPAALDPTATGNPAEPLVRALRAALPEDAAPFVHKGATSQDIVDTAAMLIIRDALGLLLEDLDAGTKRAAGLAVIHRHTILSGRTLLQPALPTTFGLVAAGWLTALHESASALRHVREQRLAVQFGGAAGTLAALGDDGLAVADALAAELGLAAPTGPWHTDRTRVAEVAGALGTAAGAVAKVARDVALYAQAELGELTDGADRGGSSTLPQKRNPVAAIAAAAGAAQAPGLVATLLASMPHEFQRAAGAWHAEWRPLRALLEATGSAAHWLRDCLDNLVVHPDRMRDNAARVFGALMAERAGAVLAAHVGVAKARDLVRETVTAKKSLRELVGRYDPDEDLDPADYLGSTPALVDRALRARLPAPVALHHEISGPADAPPLLLLNSLGSDLSMWDGQIGVLSQQFRVIRCDTRGHGRSPVPAGPYTVDDLGSDVLALLDSLGVERAHVAGVSLGGLLGMWLATHAATRVDGLALVCTAATFPTPESWTERAALVRESGAGAVADAVVARWFTADFAARERGRVAAARAMIAATPAEGYAACCEALATADMRPFLGAVRAPTIVVSGAEDPTSPPERGEELAAAIRGASFVEIPDAAHVAPLERPAAVTGLLTLFLEGR